MYEYKKIRVPKRLMYFSQFEGREIDIITELKYEMVRFSPGKSKGMAHLDILDSQTLMMNFHRTTPFVKSKKKRKPQPGSFFYYREKMKRYNKNPLRNMYSIAEVWDKIEV